MTEVDFNMNFVLISYEKSGLYQKKLDSYSKLLLNVNLFKMELEIESTRPLDSLLMVQLAQPWLIK